jgi:hypothetical protein
MTKTPLCPIDLAAGGGAPRCQSDWQPLLPSLPEEDPACGYVLGEEPNIVQSASLEADGMCHARSAGSIVPLVDDVVRGGQSGPLAFLAVGAALLLWPRLRATR